MNDTGRQGMQQRRLEQLHALRDALRLEMHLAGMELRERWERLEPRVGQVERRAQELGEEGRWLVEELTGHLRQLRKELQEHRGQRQHPRA